MDFVFVPRLFYKSKTLTWASTQLIKFPWLSFLELGLCKGFPLNDLWWSVMAGSTSAPVGCVPDEVCLAVAKANGWGAVCFVLAPPMLLFGLLIPDDVILLLSFPFLSSSFGLCFRISTVFSLPSTGFSLVHSFTSCSFTSLLSSEAWHSVSPLISPYESNISWGFGSF